MQQLKQILLTFVALVVALSTNTCTAADECFRLTSVGSCWTRRCRKDQFISSFETVFQPENGDRVWKICCRNIQMPSAELSAVTCNPWTSNQNSYWGSFNFRCLGNSYMSGIHSCYSNRPIQDRRFRFRCCQTPGLVTRDCENWGINGMFQARSSFTVENGRVLKGMNGYFDTRYRDRVFENTDCAMIRR